MNTIRYKVIFHSWWHCGSGQASGADLDALVVKDKDQLPFIPGRTVKGLLRDACDELCKYDGLDRQLVTEIFGDENAAEEGRMAVKGKAFFSNASLPEQERKPIASSPKLRAYLYSSVSSTAIDENGIAKDNSLRKIEVVVPCTLEGEIHNVPEGCEVAIEKALKLIKRLGTGRAHGLGRCSFIKEN